MTVSFVTGATGFIGSHVAEALHRRGDEVRCLVRAGARCDNIEGLGARLVEGDLVAAAGDPDRRGDAVSGTLDRVRPSAATRAPRACSGASRGSPLRRFECRAIACTSIHAGQSRS